LSANGVVSRSYPLLCFQWPQYQREEKIQDDQDDSNNLGNRSLALFVHLPRSPAVHPTATSKHSSAGKVQVQVESPIRRRYRGTPYILAEHVKQIPSSRIRFCSELQIGCRERVEWLHQAKLTRTSAKTGAKASCFGQSAHAAHRDGIQEGTSLKPRLPAEVPLHRIGFPEEKFRRSALSCTASPIHFDMTCLKEGEATVGCVAMWV
jgi:hypothetical protein